jgi:hypothetical protein
MLLVALPVAAQVHKCIDAVGKTAFSDTPCPSNAKSAARILDSSATERRPEEEATAAERNMRSIEDASRILQEPTSDAQIGAPAAMVAPRQRATQQIGSAQSSPDVHPDDLACDTVSPRKGCVGGARQANPNWSPRRGYFGGGGPADQRYQQEQERAREAAARAAAAGPERVSRCDGGGCWDTSGNRYSRTGDGQHFRRSDGALCRANGNTFNCN